MSLITKYKKRVELQHGWEVELQCPECQHESVPNFDGWTASKAIRLGDTPTIYANLTCSECGHDLKEAAGGKLNELFKDVAIPARNKSLMYGFLLFLIGLPLILVGIIWAGVAAGWWSYGAFVCLGMFAFLSTPAIFYFNYKVHAIRCVCECGNPRYLSMGLLGRSYCYRCSCGRLLRLRDCGTEQGVDDTMTESSTNTLFGLTPKRYGFASLIAVGLTFASWPLMVVIGFIMVYVAVLLAMIAVVSGLLGVCSGIYFKEWGAVVAGALGSGLAVIGVCSVISALSSF